MMSHVLGGARVLLKQLPHAEKLARKLVSLYPLSARLGREFWEWYSFLNESESWTVQELHDFQFEQLRSLLLRLVKSSPFYARRLAGVPINSLGSREELRRLIPSLGRKEFAADYADIVSQDFRSRPSIGNSTSGTTGNALQFLHPAKDQAREWASVCHGWKRVGYDPARSRRAEFRGLTQHGALFEEYPEQNMVRFSIVNLRSDTLPKIGEIITSRKLQFFHGYPSALYLLAREVLSNGLLFPQPTAVLLASEMVYDTQLEIIHAAFPEARLFAHYGCAERTVLAAWCEHRRVYHVLPQYSLVEIDPLFGEIIGTNLYNDINGFVRYRMTDVTRGVDTLPCPACCRPYTPIITTLDGRKEDFLYSLDRGWIPPAIVTYPLKSLRCVSEIQFHQDTPEIIRVDYILRSDAAKEMAANELQGIEAGLGKLMGRRTQFQFRCVTEIARGPTGKYKWIVNRLDCFQR
jgi:phenylacetate-CoA ligase